MDSQIPDEAAGVLNGPSPCKEHVCSVEACRSTGHFLRSKSAGLLWLLLALSGEKGTSANYEPSNILPPGIRREFRGAWIATVANLDWPSRPGLGSAQQQAELVTLLDRAVQLKLNAIIFQVRPACDAVYASSLEPWSEYLTGTMGKAPLPYYDPLEFAVTEAHRRGLELHAWFNPFRAGHSSSRSALAPNHVGKTHPQWVKHYGSQLWLDPGEKGVQEHSLSVILDVVRRYNIDAVHLDDYFYPYQEKDNRGNELEFPDETSWNKFGSAGGLKRDDWRRENVNGFVRRLYESIKTLKPWVKFGISPFGIWRPGAPSQIKGYDAYSKLYADSRKWLAEGWVDYLAPQLYWSIDSPEQSFPVLLKWWGEQNRKGRNLYAGLDATKTGGKWNAQEIVNQIRITRQRPGVSGHIHWDMKMLARGGPLPAKLERDVYTQPALAPASAWLSSARPKRPQVFVGFNQRTLQIRWSARETATLWVLQTRRNGQWVTEILPGQRTTRAWTGSPPEVVALSAIDRNGNASPAAVLERSFR